MKKTLCLTLALLSIGSFAETAHKVFPERDLTAAGVNNITNSENITCGHLRFIERELWHVDPSRNDGNDIKTVFKVGLVKPSVAKYNSKQVEQGYPEYSASIGDRSKTDVVRFRVGRDNKEDLQYMNDLLEKSTFTEKIGESGDTISWYRIDESKDKNEQNVICITK
ncbi:hypothetical protein HBN50_06660 [Halobacteriovorax sp. GB3]|uniref:hypothetical protein n=1 Tax=Halobacteriovorax sp. GB3 TaxID=2719615 RepID=UPI0023621AE8|nr:hypothetical protein [Halobacteriovorax sp. GB3]MDD0852768.1 hypothetical protein [Halobacteriovorax sp. GB3]